MRFAPQLLAVAALGLAACGEPAALPAPVQLGADGLPLGHLPIPRAPRVPGACTGAHAGALLSGTVSLAPGVAARPGVTLRLSARSSAGGEETPASLLLLVPSPTFPLDYDLTTEDSVGGAPLPAELMVEARLGEGDTSRRSAGELAGAAPARVLLGASGVDLVLSPAAALPDSSPATPAP